MLPQTFTDFLYVIPAVEGYLKNAEASQYTELFLSQD